MPVQANIYYHIYERNIAEPRPPVVLIHGAGGNHLYWPSEIRRLAGHRIYAVDLPGHGKSPGIGKQSIPAYCSAILTWMGSIKIHNAVMIGHSMGAAIALTLALLHPEHVLGLGLIGAGARLSVNPILLENSSNPTTFASAVASIISLSFGPDTPDRLVELATQRMRETRPSVLHGDFLACNAFDVTDRLSKILTPTLVLCGDQDKMTPPRLSQYLHSSIPGSQISIIRNAGHMVMLEKPAEVLGALNSFLDEIPL
jgi:pimeloyl-ACP methyl ester carboxylesterase